MFTYQKTVMLRGDIPAYLKDLASYFRETSRALETSLRKSQRDLKQVQLVAHTSHNAPVHLVDAWERYQGFPSDSKGFLDLLQQRVEEEAMLSRSLQLNSAVVSAVLHETLSLE